MKTLDEIVKSYELSCGKKDCSQCPYDDDCLDHHVCECYERMDDTYHYLKEYRENKSGLEKTKEALEVKRKIYEDMTEKIMQQGQENEARCQAEITRYQEAVKNCERAENIYKQKQKAAEDALWICKDDKDDLTALRAYWKEQHENNALTWDELKQMEGKPVWIEPVKEWMFITEIEKDEGADRVWLLSLDGLDYDMGSHADWQAYRKERE